MLQKFADFIKYNNTFPILLGAFFFMTGGAFAATNPDVQQAVVDSTETVQSVDNTYIVGAALDTFDFNLQIKDVAEDVDIYTVTYSYRTIAIVDYVWQVVEKDMTLSVSKTALESSYVRDLGLYVAKELSDNIKAELAYLKRVQSFETESGMTQKVVAVEYTGLIGKFLDPTQEVFDAYIAVVPSENPETVKRKMSPEEISALTRTALVERKKLAQKEAEEAERLAEEKRKEEEVLALLESESATSTEGTQGIPEVAGTSTPAIPEENPPAEPPINPPVATSTEPVAPPVVEETPSPVEPTPVVVEEVLPPSPPPPAE